MNAAADRTGDIMLSLNAYDDRWRWSTRRRYCQNSPNWRAKTSQQHIRHQPYCL